MHWYCRNLVWDCLWANFISFWREFSARDRHIYSFPNNNLSKCWWIFTTLVGYYACNAFIFLEDRVWHFIQRHLHDIVKSSFLKRGKKKNHSNYHLLKPYSVLSLLSNKNLSAYLATTQGKKSSGYRQTIQAKINQHICICCISIFNRVQLLNALLA